MTPMSEQPSRADIERFLRLAMTEAELAAEAGDHSYGAVIVAPDGTIVANGRNGVNTDCDPTSHAETNAIRAACRALRTLSLAGYRLYTNGAPCTMCAANIIQSGISDVWYSAPVPEGRIMPTLEEMAALVVDGHVVSQGILAEEASAQLSRWSS